MSWLWEVPPLQAGRPLTHAQQSKQFRLGWLTTGPAADVNPFLDALRAGLAPLGYAEGRNLTVIARYADGDLGRVPVLAEELARLPVDLIATQGTATRQLQKVTAIVPVVYVFSADPVLAGIAESLARPGRNMTGITLLSAELNGKRLELLREIMPQIDRVAIIASPTHAGEELERRISIEMAQNLGIVVQYFPTPSLAELHGAYASMAADPPKAIVVFPDPITYANREQIVAFASDQARAGGLGLGRFCGSWRLVHLRAEAHGVLPTARLLRRPRSEGGETFRIANRATDDFRAGYQSENSQGP